MSSLLLLMLTVLCGFLTYDSFRWGKDLKDTPFSTISSMWAGGLSHLSLSEQNKIKDNFSSSIFGAFKFQLLFLVVTLAFAVATIRSLFA